MNVSVSPLMTSVNVTGGEPASAAVAETRLTSTRSWTRKNRRRLLPPLSPVYYWLGLRGAMPGAAPPTESSAELGFVVHGPCGLFQPGVGLSVNGWRRGPLRQEKPRIGVARSRLASRRFSGGSSPRRATPTTRAQRDSDSSRFSPAMLHPFRRLGQGSFRCRSRAAPSFDAPSGCASEAVPSVLRSFPAAALSRFRVGWPTLPVALIPFAL